MALASLEIWNLRAIEHAAVSLHPTRNVFVGENASGKTTVLEAIHLLATAKSFRPGPVNAWLRSGQSGWRVAGRVVDASGQTHTLGVEREGGRRVLRIDSQDQPSMAALAECLPVQILTPESHYAFLSDPAERRRALNWGLFHVEPEFLATWRHYQRALQQRNAALRARAGIREFTAWDRELIDAGERLTQWRVQYVEQWGSAFQRLSDDLLGPGARLSLSPGWPDGERWEDALLRTRESDRHVGYTQLGPHRADIKMEWEAAAARWRGSHGQQKLLVFAARLAQTQIIAARAGRMTTLLIDDLAAELDRERRARIFTLMASLPAQALVTAIEPDPALETWPDFALFHVEQGALRPASGHKNLGARPGNMVK